MAWFQQSQGRLAEAEPYLREVIELRRRSLGEEHPDTARSIKTLGALLWSMGRNGDAIALLAPFEPVGRSVWAETNPMEFADLLRTLGGARVALGYDAERMAMAERNLLDSHEILLAAHGEAHEQTRGCVESLVALYTAWHAAEPSNGHDAKAAEWRSRLAIDESSSP